MRKAVCKAALALALVAAVTALAPLHATTVQHFTLAQMTDNADTVVRARVIEAKAGSFTAGGSELPMVTYKLQVEELFKGSALSKGDAQYLEVRMLGQLKADTTATIQHLSIFRDVPSLTVGQEYLLMFTPPSAIGLSTTVGLGQGAFVIQTTGKAETASNLYGNAGLFDGPIDYTDLASRVRALVER